MRFTCQLEEKSESTTCASDVRLTSAAPSRAAPPLVTCYHSTLCVSATQLPRQQHRSTGLTKPDRDPT
ncbi:hypothetical protein CsSME_00009358 [Camellia sinensis var. sinensis]